jgi:hypothetical protein
MSGPGIIAAERDQVCELCGKIDECRPYGPNGEQICFECGQLDEEGTKKRMMQYIWGRNEKL